MAANFEEECKSVIADWIQLLVRLPPPADYPIQCDNYLHYFITKSLNTYVRILADKNLSAESQQAKVEEFCSGARCGNRSADAAIPKPMLTLAYLEAFKPLALKTITTTQNMQEALCKIARMYAFNYAIFDYLGSRYSIILKYLEFVSTDTIPTIAQKRRAYVIGDRDRKSHDDVDDDVNVFKMTKLQWFWHYLRTEQKESDGIDKVTCIILGSKPKGENMKNKISIITENLTFLAEKEKHLFVVAILHKTTNWLEHCQYLYMVACEPTSTQRFCVFSTNKEDITNWNLL